MVYGKEAARRVAANEYKNKNSSSSKNTLYNKSLLWDIPGGPVVKTLPSNGRSVSFIPSPRAKIPHVSWPENQKT